MALVRAGSARHRKPAAPPGTSGHDGSAGIAGCNTFAARTMASGALRRRVRAPPPAPRSFGSSWTADRGGFRAVTAVCGLDTMVRAAEGEGPVHARRGRNQLVTSEEHSGAGRGTLLLADISGYTAFLQAVAGAHAADMAAGAFVPKAYPAAEEPARRDCGTNCAAVCPVQARGGRGVCLRRRRRAGRPWPIGGGPPDRVLRRLSRLCWKGLREIMACGCDACVSIGGLELKFVLHHGDYVVQSIAGHQELLGPEVTISHLLLKNHVVDLIGRSAYALVTESAVASSRPSPGAGSPDHRAV